MKNIKETTPEKKQVFNIKHNSPPDPNVTTLAKDQEQPTSTPVTGGSIKAAQEKARAVPLGSGLLKDTATKISDRERRMKEAIEGITK